MKLDMTFEESNQRIDMTFAEVQTASDGGFERGYEQGYTEGNEQGRKEGYSEAQEETAALFGIQNEVTGTNIVTCDYVNENEHNVEVKLSSDTVTDFSGVEVKCVGKNLFDINGDINQYYQGLIMHGSNSNELNDDGTISINASSSASVGRGFKVKGIATKTLTISFDVVSVGTGKGVSTSICIPSQINYDLKSNVSAGNRLILTKTFGVDVDEAIFTFYVNSGTGGIIKNVQIEVLDVATDYKPYTEKTYTANADGTVDGITSISPTMNIICEGVDITAKYYCVQDVEWHRFWDNFQLYGKRTNYFDSFRFYVNDKIFKPKYDIVPTNSTRMFSCSGGDGKYSITELKNVYPSGAIVDFSNSKDISQLFHYNTSIKHIGIINATSALALDDFANSATSLVEIEKIILKDDCSQRFNSAFYYTVRLERITFEGVIGLSINFQWSPLLSDESVQNIIDCLADLTGQTSQTLTFHADVKAKLTEEQIATITSKNWTLA